VEIKTNILKPKCEVFDLKLRFKFSLVGGFFLPEIGTWGRPLLVPKMELIMDVPKFIGLK